MVVLKICPQIPTAYLNAKGRILMIELQSAAPGIGTRHVTTVGNVKHKDLHAPSVITTSESDLNRSL